MALSCGLIGLPSVGKTTFFQLLTGAEVNPGGFRAGKAATHVQTAEIPDARLDYLTQLYHPRKTTYAQVEVVDIPGLLPGGAQAGREFLDRVREVEALVHIIRAFGNEAVAHVSGAVDVLRDARDLYVELVLADLDLVETRLRRLSEAKKKKPTHEAERAVLEALAAELNEERPVRREVLPPAQQEALANISFLTEKPLILVANLDEGQAASGDYPGAEELATYAGQRGLPLLTVCAQVEAEIARLEHGERQEFLQAMGIAEPGLNRLARTIYQSLGLISFLTAGEDEVRAWTIKKGTRAREAAGKIHSDLERGFIRAEVVAFSDLQACGSLGAARERGMVRLEGKDYQVADGDVVNFRFNV